MSGDFLPIDWKRHEQEMRPLPAPPPPPDARGCLGAAVVSLLMWAAIIASVVWVVSR